jgi:hypothetical protein
MLELIKAVVESGGSVEITDGELGVEDIRAVLGAAAISGAQVTIQASAYSTETLLELAQLGGGNLTVKFE